MQGTEIISPRLRRRLLSDLQWEPSNCWLWQGHVSKTGYGRINAGMYVHRVIYTLFVGPIPDGHQIDHLCRVRACANPLHLEAVTQRENILRSNTPGAIAARTNRCGRGHDLLVHGDVRKDGSRACRACVRFRREAQR